MESNSKTIYNQLMLSSIDGKEHMEVTITDMAHYCTRRNKIWTARKHLIKLIITSVAVIYNDSSTFHKLLLILNFSTMGKLIN